MRKASWITFEILALLYCLEFLTSCGGAPVKPAVEIGVIDYPAGQVTENMTNGQAFQKIDAIEKATSKNVTAAIIAGGNRVPLASYDKAIALRPDWWDVFINYVHALERYVQNHCGQ